MEKVWVPISQFLPVSSFTLKEETFENKKKNEVQVFHILQGSLYYLNKELWKFIKKEKKKVYYVIYYYNL